MKWSDVIRKAESMAKEDYSTADRDTWADIINDGIDRLEPWCKVSDGVEVALSVGTAEYDVPSTLRKVSSVIFVRGDSEVPLSLLNWPNRHSAGYRLPPGKIQLQEITLQAGDKLLVVGPLKIPRATADDIEAEEEITVLPEEWQWLLESFCIWRSQQKEGWLAESKEEEIRWLRGLEDFKSAQFLSQVTGKIQKREYY